jgi:hypothetical protein
VRHRRPAPQRRRHRRPRRQRLGTVRELPRGYSLAPHLLPLYLLSHVQCSCADLNRRDSRSASAARPSRIGARGGRISVAEAICGSKALPLAVVAAAAVLWAFDASIAD